MNERIKELIKQATNPDYDSDDGPMNELNVEKFAELIVRECVDVVAGVMPGYKDYRSQIEEAMRDDCVAAVKQHFGVEE